jgi:Mg2+ and Co2+ transporter CorA
MPLTLKEIVERDMAKTTVGPMGVALVDGVMRGLSPVLRGYERRIAELERRIAELERRK